MKRLLKFCGYGTYFIFMLLVFVVLSFPSDRVRKYAERQLSSQMGGTVKIGNLELGLDGSVTLENVQLTLPMSASTPKATDRNGLPGAPSASKTPKDKKEDNESSRSANGPQKIVNPPVFIVFDRLDIDSNLVSAMLGNPLEITVNGQVQNGTIKNLKLSQIPAGWRIQAEEINGINLAPTRLTKHLLGTDIWTTFSTAKAVDFTWRGSLPQSEGSLDLVLGATEIPHIMFKDPVAGPLGEAFDVAVGDIAIRLELGEEEKSKRRRNTEAVAATVLRIEEIKSRGDHLHLNLDGASKNEIRFNGPNAKTGQLDIKFVFSFTKEFFEWKGTGVRENGEKVANASHIGLQFVLESPGGPGARGRVGRKETGFRYGFRCRGLVSNPQCAPDRPSRALVPKLKPSPTSSRPRPSARPSTNRKKTTTFNRPKINSRPTSSPTPRNALRKKGLRNTSNSRTKARMVEPARPTKKTPSTSRISRKPVPTPEEDDEEDAVFVPTPLEPSVPPSVSEDEESDESDDDEVDEEDDEEDDDDEDEDDAEDDYEDD